MTGNPVIDAAHYVRNLDFYPAGTPLESVPLDRRVILATAHRRESLGEGLEEIADGLYELATSHDDVQIVFPVHLNPAVQEPVNRILGDVPNVALLPPLDYRAMIWLLEHAYFVMTDSGGLQEEASGFGKPVLVMRDVTERHEGLESGIAKLIGTSREAIVREGGLLLSDELAYAKMLAAGSPYGDGRAADRIVAGLAGTIERPVVEPLRDAWDALGARIESVIAEEGEFGRLPRKVVGQAKKLAARLTGEG